MAFDEVEDIEACVREGRQPRNTGPYLVKITQPDSDEFDRYRFHDGVLNGRQLISETGARPVDAHLIFMILRGGGFEELRLGESVDIRKRGVERFIVFASAASYRFVVEGERTEWGTKFITGAKIADIGGFDLAGFELWRARRGGDEDDLIAPDQLVDLSEPGLERFYKKPKTPEKITVIVNGRRKSVDPSGLCFADLIALAFTTPPQGEQICFTAMYRKGPANAPEGSLIEDQCVPIIEGMVFNVTATDKS